MLPKYRFMYRIYKSSYSLIFTRPNKVTVLYTHYFSLLGNKNVRHTIGQGKFFVEKLIYTSSGSLIPARNNPFGFKANRS